MYVAYPEVRRQLRPTVVERWAIEARSSQDQSVLEAVPDRETSSEAGRQARKLSVHPSESERAARWAAPLPTDRWSHPAQRPFQSWREARRFFAMREALPAGAWPLIALGAHENGEPRIFSVNTFIIVWLLSSRLPAVSQTRNAATSPEGSPRPQAVSHELDEASRGKLVGARRGVFPRRLL